MISIKLKIVELYAQVHKLERFYDELQGETWAGNGEVHWPDPNVNIDAKDKHKEDIGIHLKSKRAFNIGREVDEIVAEVAVKLDEAIDILKDRHREDAVV